MRPYHLYIFCQIKFWRFLQHAEFEFIKFIFKIKVEHEYYQGTDENMSF